eukprot:CAMPEP_0172317922 /NCGR_PEP_ID=MMETSP1058-20130122/33295_1 /TAXON_ID=83371 /ORGANISM="Detonula confervacea, Strain CCMP 353" /LENGTH=347 /DNA_ID=CAMNT_0013032609 /DNA_START=367 /DNA_END=1410 /DNA_ORIENTATION=-
MVALVYMIDSYIPKPLPVANESHSAKTVVITGANSGVGYETSSQLAVKYGVQVIMGCRSEVKCANAANTINAEIASAKSNGSVTPLLIDLSNLESVKLFASQLESRRVDVLFNNAGYAPSEHIPVNSYGLDPSFTSMHLSHFFLSERLLKSNPNLRVVNTSSGTHHFCAIPFAYMPSLIQNLFPLPQNPGCIDEDYLRNGIRSETDQAAYIQAKLANVMHAVEIPRRHPHASSIAIDLGWVGTNIQPFMKGHLTPTSLGWMRSASVGISPMLHAILTSNEELLDNLEDGRKRKDSGIVMNVFNRPEEAFSYPWWKDGTHANLSREQMMKWGEKLWEESTNLLQINGY